MRKCRWFGGKARAISKVSISKLIQLKADGETHYLSVIEVHYVQRLPELYFLPIYFASSDTLFDKVEYIAQSVICRADFQGKTGIFGGQ